MKENRRIELYYLWLPIILFIFFRFSYFTTDLYTPDELWHTGYMNNPSEITNYQGFGLIYWMFGYIISFLGHEFRLVLRILSLLSIVIASSLIFKMINNSVTKTKTLLVFLFLSSPFLWYGGKLITPEFYILPIIIYSYYFLLETSHKKLSFFLSGVCIGIKASIIPAVAPLFLHTFLKEKALNIKNLVNLIKMSSITIVGIIFSSPNIVWQPEVFFSNIPTREIQIDYYLNEFINIWQYKLNLIRAWDLVILYGFSISIFPLTSLSIMIFIFIIYFDGRRKLSLLITLSLYFLIMTLQSVYIWHMYSLIPILIYYSTILVKEHKSSFIDLSFIVIILVNLYNVNIFYHDDKNIRNSIYKDIIVNRESHTKCINDYFARLSTSEKVYVINTTSMLKTRKDITLLDEEKIMNKEHYQLVQFTNSPGININSIKDNLNDIYVLTHLSFDKLNSFRNNEKADYISSFVKPIIGSATETSKVQSCNNININKVSILSD